MLKRLSLAASLLIALGQAPAHAASLAGRADVDAYIDQISRQHGLNRDEVRATATGVAYYLHGNLVASKTYGKPLEPHAPTFLAWPTATTASRLRALGFSATIVKGVPHLDGVPL